MQKSGEEMRLTDTTNNLRHGELGLRVLSRSESDHETESKDIENETDANERLEVSSVPVRIETLARSSVHRGVRLGLTERGYR